MHAGFVPGFGIIGVGGCGVIFVSCGMLQVIFVGFVWFWFIVRLVVQV